MLGNRVLGTAVNITKLVMQPGVKRTKCSNFSSVSYVIGELSRKNITP